MITDPAERDLIIRTVIGEAAGEGPVGQLAVAHVIANRMRSAGRGARDIIMARNQFEPWGNPRTAAQLQSLTPNDPRYQRVAQALEPFFSGQSQDPTGGATHFYSPTAQAGLGRQPPSWDNGTGQDIGRHRFFALGYAPSQANNTHGIPFPGTQSAQPRSAFWDEAGRLTAGINWDDAVIDDQPEGPPMPPGAAPATPAAQPVSVKWDDEPPAGLTAPVPQPRPANAPLGSPDTFDTFAAVTPQPQGAPLAAPNLDETFAQFQGGLPTQGNTVASQRSIPEITVRPPGAQTNRQRAQLAAEQELDRAGPIAGGANAIVQGLARGVNPFMDDTAAFLNTITGQGQGNSFSERYQANLDAQRGVNAAFDSRNPILSYGSQLAGAAALPVGNMAAPANAMVRAGRGAGVGAGYGAAFGFGQGDSLEDRMQRAGTGALVGGVVGGGLNTLIGPRLPQNALTSRPPAQDVVEAAGRQGIQVPRVVATDSMAAQRLGQGIRNIPLAGNPIVRNTDRMVQQMGARLDDVAAGLGGATRDAAGADARAAITETVRSTMPARADQLYGRVDQLMPPGQAFPLSNTAQIAQDIASRTQAAGLGDSAAVKMVEEALSRPGGLTFEGMRALRTRINEMTGFSATPQGTSNAELKQIAGALTRDIDAAVASAGPQAQQAYQRANQWYAGWAQRRETLGRILNANSDEGIVNQITNAASSRASGDIWKLATARKSMPAEEWNQIASTVVARLGRDAEGNFSPARFVTDYGKLSERGKDLLFRATGNRAHAEALDDIATISSRAREVQRFGNPSGTAAAVLTGGAAFGGVSYVTGDPLQAAVSVLGAVAAGRALASAPTAASMARWSKAYSLAVKQPTAASLSALQIASRNFAATLGEKAGVTVDPNSLFRALPYQRLSQSDEDRNNVPSGGAAAP